MSELRRTFGKVLREHEKSIAVRISHDCREVDLWIPPPWITVRGPRTRPPQHGPFGIQPVNPVLSSEFLLRPSMRHQDYSSCGLIQIYHHLYLWWQYLDVSVKYPFTTPFWQHQKPLNFTWDYKENTNPVHVSYTYLYIFHVQSYILNPMDSIIEINTEITTLLYELFRSQKRSLKF